MDNNTEITLLKTIIYADIFEYPLTILQIKYYAIGKYSEAQLKVSLEQLSCIEHFKGYYFLKGKKYLVAQRRRRAQESYIKMRKVKKAARLLSLIPTIYMIGLSGSLSMKNARKDDDIDFFIITRENTLWITRLCSSIILTVVGMRRQKNAYCVKNKICLNFLISENELLIPGSRRNLYIAHEVAQVVPLYNKRGTYERFIYSNTWIKKYLPYVIADQTFNLQKLNRNFFGKFAHACLSLFDSIFYFLQMRHMKTDRKHAFVSRSRAEFYPLTYKNYVLELYNLRLVYILSLWRMSKIKKAKLIARPLN